MASEFLPFTQGFKIGLATSASQVEGKNGHVSSADRFYEQKCHELARKEVKSFDKYYEGEDKAELRKFLADPNNYIPNESCDHYRLYRQDLELFESLGMKAYRFSIPRWRIEPHPGQFDEGQIAHYKDLIDYALKIGITPLPTIQHWDSPIHVTESGDLMSSRALDNFERYVEKISPLFYELPHGISFNEAVIDQYKKHFEGFFPPGEKWNLIKWKKGIDQLVKAHKITQKVLKKVNPNIKVVMTQNIVNFKPGKDTLLDNSWLNFANRFWNDYPFEKIYEDDENPTFGVQYYYRQQRHNLRHVLPVGVQSDLRWDPYPQGLYDELIRLNKKFPRAEFIITETGIPTRNEANREWFTRGTLLSVQKAQQKGIPVSEYLAWCAYGGNTIGNRVVHEWERGYSPLADFGFIHVEERTKIRTPRPSAHILGQAARENGIWVDMEPNVPLRV